MACHFTPGHKWDVLFKVTILLRTVLYCWRTVNQEVYQGQSRRDSDVVSQNTRHGINLFLKNCRNPGSRLCPLALMNNIGNRLPLSDTSFKFGVLVNDLQAEHFQQRAPREQNYETLELLVNAGAFSQENCGRTNACCLAFVCLDREIENHAEVSSWAKKGKSRGMEIFAIAVGPNASQCDVRAVASYLV